MIDHSKLHASQHDKNKHSVDKHINQQASVQNLMSNPEETIVSDKEGKVTPPKKKKSKKRRSQGKIDEENKCEKCGKIFMKDYQYKMHTSLCRGKTTQMATCFECNKMIDQRNSENYISKCTTPPDAGVRRPYVHHHTSVGFLLPDMYTTSGVHCVCTTRSN